MFCYYIAAKSLDAQSLPRAKEIQNARGPVPVSGIADAPRHAGINDDLEGFVEVKKVGSSYGYAAECSVGRRRAGPSGWPRDNTGIPSN
jgi:hypothetical protein